MVGGGTGHSDEATVPAFRGVSGYGYASFVTGLTAAIFLRRRGSFDGWLGTVNRIPAKRKEA